jgi:uncharacterized protein YraI
MRLGFFATAAVALGAAFALPAVANAYTSYTTGSVNQRSGPGVGYGKIGTLPPGAAVDVRYCQYGWCSIASFLGSGWVSAGYLSGARAYPPRVYPQPYPYVVPPPYPRYYGPRPYFQFYFGTPRRYWW